MALPRKTASRSTGEASSASIARSASSTPNDRWSPSSPENVKITQSTPGARSARAHGRRVPREVEDHDRDERERQRREKRASRSELYREIFPRDDRGRGECARGHAVVLILRPPRDTHRDSASTATLPRGSCCTNCPSRMIAVCVASASPSLRWCVTRTSAAPPERNDPQGIAERARARLVETGVRLVEQHDTRIVDDRARNRHALLHPAAQRSYR